MKRFFFSSFVNLNDLKLRSSHYFSSWGWTCKIAAYLKLAAEFGQMLRFLKFVTCLVNKSQIVYMSITFITIIYVTFKIIWPEDNHLNSIKPSLLNQLHVSRSAAEAICETNSNWYQPPHWELITSQSRSDSLTS